MKLKIKNKYIKIVGVFLSIALLAAGCGSSNNNQTQQQVVINFWKTFEDSSNIEPLITAYQTAHPNVRIVYTKKNVDTYEQDLLNALAAGQGPDIFSINNAWLPAYMDKVTPAPTTAFTYSDFKNAFVDAVENDFTVNQKIYGVAMSVDSLALYYNKDILGTVGIATPPKTWAELATDVQKIKKADTKGYFTRSGIAMGTNANVNRAVDILYLFMLQKGVVPYSSDGTQPTFSQSVQKNGNYTDPGLDALTYYTSFANPYSPNYNWNSRSDYSVDAFANGRSAMMLSYSYAADTIKQKNPNLNFDVAAVPQPNLDDPSVNFANYWGEVVSKQSKNSAVAWDFLKFLSSKTSLDKYYAKHKLPSSRKDLISLQIQDPEIGVFANANLTAKAFYRPDQAKMDTIFGRMIDNVILNGLTADRALNQALQEASAISRQQ
ncbi:MAG: extracellular solute-binding protein [Candidatus Doudnabacteria bacterium]|nr:extracellular solute-binding protein [Candidatus Doudnabacteria bacterium]